MTLRIIRAFFVLCCMVMGVLWTSYLLDVPIGESLSEARLVGWNALGAGVGGVIGLAVVFGLRFVTQELFERLFPTIIAITFSMMVGYFAAKYIRHVTNMVDPTLQLYFTTTLILLFGMIGIYLGLTMTSNWQSILSAVQKRQLAYSNPKIVDTSVIIDGRIADIVKTGFVEGTLIVPRFVLQELQHIADSPDVLRRAKGRRGLDILKDMQGAGSLVKIEVVDDDPEAKEVDEKLMILAKEYDAKIMTNDYNLNKVAQIEGISVLNVNDLANALKPAALPDERLEVKIVKEGKEASQGVGYLDDGTMIVVDGGRDHVGQTVPVVVTSVLQTAAGRMIFTKLAGAA